MTLTVTVVAVVVGMLILVGVALSLSRTAASVAEANRQQATQKAEAILDSYETRLADDPTFFLRQVHPLEWPRLCELGNPQRIVDPGKTWPKDCGGVWSYLRVGEQAEHEGLKGRLEIYPPVAGDGQYRLVGVAREGNVEVATERRYAPITAATYALWTAGDLDLGAIAGTELQGDVYAGGAILLAEGRNPNQLVRRGVVGAEGGIFPHVPASTDTQLWLEGAALRGRIEEPLTAVPVREQIAELADLACRTAVGDGSDSKRTATLCLKAGAQLQTAGGAQAVVPESTKTYSIQPVVVQDGGDVQRLRIWVSDKEIVGGSDCVLRCSLPSLAGGSEGTADHPAKSTWWTTYLGEFNLPDHGVIYADGDVQLGMCGAGFLTEGGECALSEVATTFTLVAGGAEGEADIWIGAPVGGDATAAAVTAGSIVIPYWSRPPAGNLEVRLAAVGLSGLELRPEVVATGLAGNSNPQGGTLAWTGSLTVGSLPARSNLFQNFSLTHDPALMDNPPPYMVGFRDQSAAVVHVGTANASELCGGECFPGG